MIPLAVNASRSIYRPGHGQLAVEVVAGQSAAVTSWSSNPLKLLVPQARGQSVWACLSSYGGGLVAGDQTRFDLRIGAGARCYVGTQASTKVYRNPQQVTCSHVTHAEVGADALLVFTPDAVQAFAHSIYTQRQEFHLAAGAGLVVLDWCNSGRVARGERWAFTRYHSRNDIFVQGERVLLDSLLLDAADGSLDEPHRLGRFNCVALLGFIGKPLGGIAKNVLAEISARPVSRNAPLIFSASPWRDGVLVRIAGESQEVVAHELRRYLQPLAGLLGDDPWARKW